MSKIKSNGVGKSPTLLTYSLRKSSKMALASAMVGVSFLASRGAVMADESHTTTTLSDTGTASTSEVTTGNITEASSYLYVEDESLPEWSVTADATTGVISYNTGTDHYTTVSPTTFYEGDSTLGFSETQEVSEGSEGLTVTPLQGYTFVEDGLTSHFKDVTYGSDEVVVPVENRVVAVGNVETAREVLPHKIDYVLDETIDFGTQLTTVQGTDGYVESSRTYTVDKGTGLLSNPSDYTVVSRVEPCNTVIAVGGKPESRTVLKEPITEVTMEDSSMPVGTRTVVEKGSQGYEVIRTTYSLDSKTGFVIPKEEVVASVATVPRKVLVGMKVDDTLPTTVVTNNNTDVTETPVTETPVTETPVTETPVTETPVTEKPVLDALEIETPTDEATVKDKEDASVAETLVKESPIEKNNNVASLYVTSGSLLEDLKNVGKSPEEDILPTADIPEDDLDSHVIFGNSFLGTRTSTSTGGTESKDTAFSRVNNNDNSLVVNNNNSMVEDNNSIKQNDNNNNTNTSTGVTLLSSKKELPSTGTDNNSATSFIATLVGLGFLGGTLSNYSFSVNSRKKK